MFDGAKNGSENYRFESGVRKRGINYFQTINRNSVGTSGITFNTFNYRECNWTCWVSQNVFGTPLIIFLLFVWSISHYTSHLVFFFIYLKNIIELWPIGIVVRKNFPVNFWYIEPSAACLNLVFCLFNFFLTLRSRRKWRRVFCCSARDKDCSRRSRCPASRDSARSRAAHRTANVRGAAYHAVWAWKITTDRTSGDCPYPSTKTYRHPNKDLTNERWHTRPRINDISATLIYTYIYTYKYAVWIRMH